MTDEEIARSVNERHVHVDIKVSWFTPSGRRRAAPSYEAEIHNDYLNETRSIKGKSAVEVEQKCRDQFSKWDEREIRGRIKDAHDRRIADEKAAAIELERNAEARIQSIESLLATTLANPVQLDWEALYERGVPEAFAEPPPNEPTFDPPPARRRSLFEALLPWVRALREHEARRVRACFDDCRWDALRRWQDQHSQWRDRSRAYQREAVAVMDEQKRHNQRIDDFQMHVLQGEQAAIESYIQLALETRPDPEAFKIERKIAFDPVRETVIAELTLPPPERLSDVAGGKYSKGSAVVTHMAPRAHAALYDSAVRQAALSTMHDVFNCIETTVFSRVIVNGWVHHIDRATGQDTSSCILSVASTRAEFSRLNLARVESVDCLKRLNASSGAAPSQLVAIEPLST